MGILIFSRQYTHFCSVFTKPLARGFAFPPRDSDLKVHSLRMTEMEKTIQNIVQSIFIFGLALNFEIEN